MKTVKAVYEGGVFRPIVDVDLPETCEVEFEPRVITPENNSNAAKKKAIAILSRRYRSGEADVAARHDEHQP